MEWIDGVKLTNQSVRDQLINQTRHAALLHHMMLFTHTCVHPYLCRLYRQAMAEAGLSVVDFVNIGIECTLRQVVNYIR